MGESHSALFDFPLAVRLRFLSSRARGKEGFFLHDVGPWFHGSHLLKKGFSLWLVNQLWIWNLEFGNEKRPEGRAGRAGGEEGSK